MSQDAAARRAEVDAEVAAAGEKHAALVEYLADAMASASVSGEGAPPPAERRPASDFEEPASAAEAWRVQQAVVRRIKERHPRMKHVGYKLGATSEAAQKRLGLGAPFVGPIFAQRVFSSGARFTPEQLARETVRGVELEIAWSTALPFFGGNVYSPRAVKETLGDLWAVAELPAHRFAPGSEVSGLMTIADCGGSGNFVLAARFPHNWERIDDVSKVYCDLVRGDECVEKGIGQNVMGSPVTAVTVGANALAWDDGQTVPRGVLISSGTMTDLHTGGLRPGDVYRGLFKRDEERVVGWLGFSVTAEGGQ